MKILIIQQKMIGDVLTSSILFEAIKKQFPNSELHYVINSHTYPVVKENPFIDNFQFFTPEIEHNKNALLNFAKHIKKEKYDVVIDAYSKLSSNLISFYSSAKVKISKYKWYSAFLYSHPIKYVTTSKSNAGLAIENRLQLIKPLGITTQIVKPKIYLTNQELTNAKVYLQSNSINLNSSLFMVNVLGSSNNKTYPLSNMAKIIDTIAIKTKGQILFNYIPNQIDQAKSVYNFCNAETKKHIHFNVFGSNLREFLAITKYCTALIGNEGGAINMAKALNISTFSIFSPWIDKNTWNMFEDGKTHTSIHLKGCKPELYKSKSLKKIKDRASMFYEAFLPELIIPKLNNYLSNL